VNRPADSLRAGALSARAFLGVYDFRHLWGCWGGIPPERAGLPACTSTAGTRAPPVPALTHLGQDPAI
jgi:hypothetical protein